MIKLVKFFASIMAVVIDYPLIGGLVLIGAVICCASNYAPIQIKYFVDGMVTIKKIKVGDWIDLRAAETVELKAGELKNIRLGVGMILPDGYEAHVLPRSSTPQNFGIISANSMGIIDNSYSGDSDEWSFPAVALRDTIITKNDRIAQFRIVTNQPKIKFNIVQKLNKISRGGIGSTGRY